MEDLKEAKDRVGKGINGMIKDYIKRDSSGSIESIICRKCGTLIQGFVEDEVIRTEKIGKNRRDVIKMKFKRLNSYSQAIYELGDGSLWEPPLCKMCSKSVEDKDGESLFCCHLNEVIKRGNLIHIKDQMKYEVKRKIGVK